MFQNRKRLFLRLMVSLISPSLALKTRVSAIGVKFNSSFVKLVNTITLKDKDPQSCLAGGLQTFGRQSTAYCKQGQPQPHIIWSTS